MSFGHKSEIHMHSAAAMEGTGVGSTGHSGYLPPILPSSDATKPTPRVIQTRPVKPLTDSELRSRIMWQKLLSPHFVFQFDEAWFPLRQAQSILEELEQAYSLIFSFTHEAFTDRWTVFAADQRSSDLQEHQLRSHIDCAERTLCLLQTSSQPLYANLVTLLSHALRSRRYERNYFNTVGWASLEDAFALFLNERIALQPEVYPFFGADPDLIAHHLYYHHSSASITRSWDRSPLERSWLDPILFGAFFLYLGDTFSDDRIVEFSKLDGPVTTNEFKEFFGAPLDELEHAWIAHLPISLLSVTHDEQEEMVMRWNRAIDSPHF